MTAAAPKSFEGLPAEKWIDLYTVMMRIRQFEERIMPLLKEGKIKGTAHPSVGQEAVAAGVCGVLEPSDYIVSNHRGHGHCIAKGMKTAEMMAELFGKRTGSNKGKGGSMHIADLDQYIIGCTGIVGSGAPIAGGAALAAKMRNTGQAVVCFFGDGGINQGVVFEAMNMAAIWKLPVIFVCENNLYALSTPVDKMTALKQLADRAQGFGFPGHQIAGNDLRAVVRATREALHRARSGLGPTLLECKTYRWYGHSAMRPDTRAYRQREEELEWRERDPVALAEKELGKAGLLTPERIGQIQREVAKEIEDAIEFAERSPDPDLPEMFTDVYAPY
ncbi:MAG TPA: thiamine pyrophosphate-dependent dehydrogenase E1 component subunit alpha [Methylomirabilota bacterium]|jgi:TPP-dependent pyruvate/acetoin dehydrogenase alpha subunit|nr:thiamine pyrophosphate-dependent dehydrogenase E1 component subunit alpha [Methylomirabilota bacterium]